MDILDLIKKLFPKPIWPQKRYILVIFALAYVGLKSFFVFYENPKLERLVDEAKLIGLFLMTDNDVDTIGYDEKPYGETA